MMPREEYTLTGRNYHGRRIKFVSLLKALEKAGFKYNLLLGKPNIRNTEYRLRKN